MKRNEKKSIQKKKKPIQNFFQGFFSSSLFSKKSHDFFFHLLSFVFFVDLRLYIEM